MEILASGRQTTETALARVLDALLLACALLTGAAIPGAWLATSVVGGLAAAAGLRRPTVLDKPYALLGLAVLLGAGPAVSWAGFGPIAAVLLVGAIRDGARAWRLGALFVCGIAARGAVASAGIGAPQASFAFLAGAALVWIAAASIAGRLPLPMAIPAAILVYSLRGADSPAFWALAVAIGVMAVLGRRMGRAAPLLAIVAVAGAFASPGGAASLLEPGVGAAAGPRALALIAMAWCAGAVLAALRRGWKAAAPPKVSPSRFSMAGTGVLGAAGVVGYAVASAAWGDLPSDAQVGAALALLVSCGLASAGDAARPSAEEGLGLPEEPIEGPRSRKAAAGAALSWVGAVLGSTTALRTVPSGAATASLFLLLLLSALHLPLLQPAARLLPQRALRIAGSLRGLAVFAAGAFLVAGPLAAVPTPGSIEWWRSPGALVALFGVGAAVAGAGHAIRRPGRIGPAPVAGALVCAGTLAFLVAVDYALWPTIDARDSNFAVTACVISMLFVAWSGPLSFGEAELPGVARRFSRLPAATVALCLAAWAVAGR